MFWLSVFRYIFTSQVNHGSAERWNMSEFAMQFKHFPGYLPNIFQSHSSALFHISNIFRQVWTLWTRISGKRPKIPSYPSGEYSRLNTAPWVWVLRLIDSTAGFIEQYKLVIVLKLSLAGSTNTPRLIVLLCSHENRLFPLRLSVLETSLLPVGGSADGRLPGSRSPGAGDLALPSVRSPLLSGGEGEPTRAMSSSTSESSLPLLGLSWDSSASSLSLWCSELIVASPASTQPSVFRGAVSTAKGWLTPVTYRAWNRVFFQPFRMPWQWVLAA